VTDSTLNEELGVSFKLLYSSFSGVALSTGYLFGAIGVAFFSGYFFCAIGALGSLIGY